MSEAILFVCQSCHSARLKLRDRSSDGAILGDRGVHLLRDRDTGKVHESQSSRESLFC